MKIYSLAMALGFLLCITGGDSKATFLETGTETERQSEDSVSPVSCMDEPITINLPNEGDSANFSSPNYPDKYPAFKKCGWKFTTEPSNHLELYCPTVQMSWLATFSVTDGEQTIKENCFVCEDTAFNHVFQSKEAIVGLDNNFFFRGEGFDCSITALKYPAASTTCTCGLSAASRIVGGFTTEENRYPWMAILAYSTTGSFFCGGSVISDQFVLTAAHCVQGKDAPKIQVKLGFHKIYRVPTSSIVVTVLEIIPHPLYKSRGYDAALLRIPPIDFDAFPTIRPVCLPLGSSPYTDLTATATGWGDTREGGFLSGTLLETFVPTHSNADCNEFYGGTITASMICAGTFRRDTCQGDSGGPLTVANSGGYDEIIGITSWGIGCGREGYPGVYTRVTVVRRWILKEISSTTTCALPT